MNQMTNRGALTWLVLVALLLPILAACGGGEAAQEPVVVETVAPEGAAPDEGAADDSAADEGAAPDEGAADDSAAPDEGAAPDDEGAAATDAPATTGEWATPHPILSDQRVRQALAYCANRPELIESVYPFLDEAERANLLMDTFLPQGHWALPPQDQLTVYPFDPEQGSALLEEAGWTLDEGEEVRLNADGEPLSLGFTTTNAEFRITWASVLEQQLLENCGIQIIRTHAPGSWWFGSATGLQRRDFELGAFAWVGQADPGGTTLYACNQIPLPSNNWEGQNYMGWCNPEASAAIYNANNTLDREQRIEQFTIVQQAFTEDMISLPLFNRLEAVAASNNVEGIAPNPTTDSYLNNITEWSLADGSDTLVLGFSQEPATLFLPVESAAVANAAASLMMVRLVNTADYDYQPAALEELPTIENGGTTDTVVTVSEGDTVWLASLGERAELEAGMEVLNADGELVIYEGGDIEMRQLAVTFELPEGLTWEDGEPVKAADFELANTIQCDPESGAVTLTICDSQENVEFTDTSYTITYLPGARWSEYFAYSLGTYSNLFTVGAYPSHRELADGRTLAEVPASEWTTLTEVAEQPLSYGPYRLVEWQKGQRMVFEVNPNYYAEEPAIKTIIIQFFEDNNQAVAQLLTGDVDVLGTETLGGGPELETVFEAADAGDIQAFEIVSPTWEHIDMNLFIR